MSDNVSDKPFDAVAYYRELFRLYAEGKGPTSIGKALGRSANTIKGQIQNFRKKGIIRDDRTLDEEIFSEWLDSPGGMSAISQLERGVMGDRKAKVSDERPTEKPERKTKVSAEGKTDRTDKTDVLGERLTEGEVAGVRDVVAHLDALREVLAWWGDKKQEKVATIVYKRGQTRSVTVRMPKALFEDIEAEAKAREVGISDVVRERLEQEREG